MNKKGVIRFLRANWRNVRNLSELITSYKSFTFNETETMEEAIPLVEHCKNFLRDNAHQIRGASSIRGIESSLRPIFWLLYQELRDRKSRICNFDHYSRRFFGFERFFFQVFGFGANFGRFFGF